MAALSDALSRSSSKNKGMGSNTVTPPRRRFTRYDSYATTGGKDGNRRKIKLRKNKGHQDLIVEDYKESEDDELKNYA